MAKQIDIDTTEAMKKLKALCKETEKLVELCKSCGLDSIPLSLPVQIKLKDGDC